MAKLAKRYGNLERGFGIGVVFAYGWSNHREDQLPTSSRNQLSSLSVYNLTIGWDCKYASFSISVKVEFIERRYRRKKNNNLYSIKRMVRPGLLAQQLQGTHL